MEPTTQTYLRKYDWHNNDGHRTKEERRRGEPNPDEEWKWRWLKMCIRDREEEEEEEETDISQGKLTHIYERKKIVCER